jgi:hypothetical protein
LEIAVQEGEIADQEGVKRVIKEGDSSPGRGDSRPGRGKKSYKRGR